MIRPKNLIFLTVLLNILWFSSVFGGEVDFDLRNYILQNNAEGYTPVIVVLADRFDAARAVNSFRTSKIELAERHRIVVNELRSRAASLQIEVINKIEQLKSSGEVLEYTPLWISNMIGMTARLSAIDEIAGMAEVETVVYDAEMELIEPVPDTDPNLGDDIESVEAGLTAIRADEVWAMGITGRGVVVSHLDTGVDGGHPTLFDRWRGHDPRYTNNPEWAWHDPLTHTTFPFDDGLHGTHTMGTICGRSNNSDDTIGVAVDAEWISAGVIDRGGDLPTRMLRYMLSFQWVIDPDGDPETFWDVPAVCSNSWGHTLSSFPGDPCNEYYWETLDNMEAAGICVVFAAGNEGNEGLRVPANRATDAFNSFAVGAVDGNNPRFPIAGFSSRGPSYCTPDGRPAIKPEVVAPGVNVRSASPGGGYRIASGTSMACPHVAGVVALMKQANPNLAPEEIKQILMDTAGDLGDPGEDNTYGWGIIDAYEAVNAAIAMLDDYGYVTGRITDIITGDPLFGKVSLIDHIEPIFGYADPDGYYGIWIPADTSLILKAEYPPDYLPSYDTIAIAAHETLTVDFALEPRVPVILRASFGNPGDIAYKTFYCKGSWDADGFFSNEWSAPFKDMRDDGRYPDQVANDGIFTGEVKLATDTINTYQWAVYSENYTDEAFLQAGQGFAITNPANPPVVPILSVNPSGVQHNWTLTVFDSVRVMVSDLSPGYGGLPYQWSGTATMEAGTTYDFRIYPMQAPVASYGIGGVGGASFRVTPNYTEEFTFIFNDNNDSLVIDSDHPAPGGFLASDDMDEKIELAWLIPRIDPIEYFIYRSDSETGPFTQIGSVSHPDTTYLDEPVNNHQDYYYYVTANYTGNIESIASNIDRGYAVVGARLAVDPSNFEVEVRQGQSTIRNLYITNEGEIDLHYELTAVQDGMSGLGQSGPGAPQPFTRYGSYGDKVDSREEPFLPPNVDSRGGPDSAGYVWIDSDQNGGPDYNWIDITGIGTPVDLGDDENVGPFSMDFDFVFYDSTFNSYRICSNGFISFTSTAFTATNARIPWANSPENLLAPFWDDLDPTSGGQVYRYESDDTVIVSYENIPRFHTSDYFTFQVLMLSSGSIVFQYSDVDSVAGNSATIGIQNGDGSIGLEVVYNEHYVHNNLAILFQRTWLYTFPFAGVVEPGMTDTVDIVFDASYLEPGDFIGHLAVEGFDLYHNEPSIDVPVVMHVTPYTSVDEDHSANLPAAFRLYQNYPNPFNPSTEIRYDLPAAGEVRLEIYNILGQLVDVPFDGYQQAGYKSVRWDGTDGNGRRIASGIYFYRLRAGEYSQAKKMLMLK